MNTSFEQGRMNRCFSWKIRFHCIDISLSVAWRCPLFLHYSSTSLVNRTNETIALILRQNLVLSNNKMPFYSPISLSTKYSSIHDQKIHENKYKQFLQTLSNNRNTNKNLIDEKTMCSRKQIYSNENYFIQRQINQQSRQDKRKREYERIQKENLRFTQKLINAKAYLNRSQQQIFFDKHCQLRQRLQYYSQHQSLPRITTKPISQKTNKSTSNPPPPPPSNIINWNPSVSKKIHFKSRSSISTSESSLSAFFHLK